MLKVSNTLKHVTTEVFLQLKAIFFFGNNNLVMVAAFRKINLTLSYHAIFLHAQNIILP